MNDIPFFLHGLGQAELDSLAAVLKEPFITTGKTVERFESRFGEYLGARHALAVTSCTGAMHMSLLALGIGPGDEVITTPMTFVATTLAIIEAGATPVFVDVELETGNMDAARVEQAITDKTKALLPVHLYGQMCDMKKLRDIADRHGLKIIEDSAHCIEGSRDGIRPGRLSDAACFSFYATKSISCGEGGALVCNDPDLYEQLKLLRLHGMTKTAWNRYRDGNARWDVVLPGWKYNMSNIEAALLLPQMERIDANLAKREYLAQRYIEKLAAVPSVRIPARPDGTVHARHLFSIWIENADRDRLLTFFHERGVGAAVNYTAVHLFDYFRKTYGFEPEAFPVAKRMGETTLSLPFYPAMPVEHIDGVIDTLVKGLAVAKQCS